MAAIKQVTVKCKKPFTDVKIGKTHTPNSSPFLMDEDRAKKLAATGVVEVVTSVADKS